MIPNVSAEPLPVCRACDLDRQPPESRWLIRSLWGRAAVGIVGGPPKVCKSWYGIDMAISVASATPCLRQFAVDDPGPTLIYLAEDSLPDVRFRIDAICQSRSLALEALDLQVITVPGLRLDLERDRERLWATLELIRPRMLLLDPLVRLHRLDENSSLEISGLLGYLRELQRGFDSAVVLVHHASKKHHAQSGQSLRGSSDLHAWTDSSAFLAWRRDTLVLSIEHRNAPAPEPIGLELHKMSDGTASYLEILPGKVPVVPNGFTSASAGGGLTEAVLEFLKSQPAAVPRKILREKLRVNNNRLGQVLDSLEDRRLVHRTADGCRLGPAPPSPP